MQNAAPEVVAVSLDNDEVFVIETLQYGALIEPVVGAPGSSNCNCNSNSNGSSEDPIA